MQRFRLMKIYAASFVLVLIMVIAGLAWLGQSRAGVTGTDADPPPHAANVVRSSDDNALTPPEAAKPIKEPITPRLPREVTSRDYPPRESMADRSARKPGHFRKSRHRRRSAHRNRCGRRAHAHGVRWQAYKVGPACCTSRPFSTC